MMAALSIFAQRLSTTKEGVRHLIQCFNDVSRLQHALRRAPSLGPQVSTSYSTYQPAAIVKPPPLDLAQLNPATLTEVIRRKKDILEGACVCGLHITGRFPGSLSPVRATTCSLPPGRVPPTTNVHSHTHPLITHTPPSSSLTVNHPLVVE